jgi:hypothetical protein
VTLVLGNQVRIWLARCFTSGDVFDFITLTTFQPKFFRDLWTFIVGTGLGITIAYGIIVKVGSLELRARKEQR